MNSVRWLCSTLSRHFGRQRWWPARSPFEVAVGALLTQQTNWRNVKGAIANLRRAGLLSPLRLASASPQRICSLIRCTGFYRQKGRRLRKLARFFAAGFDARDARAREKLLSLEGVGKETADSILLYAFNKPFFPIDAYTFRLCARFPIPVDGYEDARALFERELGHDVGRLKAAHANIVELCKRYCLKNKPLCASCPLSEKCKGINKGNEKIL